MFRLILGGISANKEEYIYRLVKENAEKGAYRQIVLVPETLSHHAERMLCTVCGDAISLRSEVLTFRRFANRVLTTFGGLAESTLDDGGRILLMYRAYELVRSKLTLYYRADNVAELLESLLSVTDELLAAGATAETLAKTASAIDGRLHQKLSDIALIYGAYRALCEKRDPKDVLTRIGDILDEHADFYAGTSLYLFGFSGFTPQEKRILRHLIRGADEVYAAFDCPTLDEVSDDGVYAKPAKNALLLRQYAEESGKRIETVTLDFRTEPSDLAFLEQNFFSYNGAEYIEKPGHILCRTALTPYSECEFTAAVIKERIAASDARYRDFAVLTADPTSYAPTLSAVFERYELPLFDGVKTDVMATPAAVFIQSALKTVTGGFDSAELFRWLKTGLSHISYSDIQLIENYCSCYELTGSAWTSEKAWNMNPHALTAQMDDNAREDLARINEIRTNIRTPLLKLKNALSNGLIGREKAAAFYDFLTECDLYASLTAQADALRDMHELTAADEYDRIWDVLCACFDSFVDTVGDLPMTPAVFAELFVLCMSCYDVSVIPSSIDRIHTGIIASIGFHRPKMVFILGATDGVLPSAIVQSGIFSDPDRIRLEEAGLELSDTPSLRSAQEQLALLTAFAAPTEKLILSCSETALDGTENRPSPYLQQLSGLFPALAIEKESLQHPAYKLYSPSAALAYAVSRADPYAEALFTSVKDEVSIKELLAQSRPNRDTLANADINHALYGNRLTLTASRVDCFNTCPYQYFARYGLRLKPHRKIGFDAPEAGTFLHDILENTIRDCEERYGRFADAAHAAIHDIANLHIDRYIHEELGDFEGKTPRFQYLFKRLKQTVYDLLDDLREEFSRSAFRPTDFELEFGYDKDLPPIEVPLKNGETASFIGVVDRVDTYLQDDTLYLRIADYKSGTKTFSYGDLHMGLGLQMPLYLAALEETFDAYRALHKEFKEVSHTADAGILYVPAKIKPITSQKHLDNDAYTQAFAKGMMRSGVVTSDPEILTAMENTALTKARYLPVKFNKDGTLSKTSNAIDEEQFALLKTDVRTTLVETAEKIRRGNVEAAPILTNPQTSPCDYCDYKTMCLFSDDTDTCRHVQTLKSEDYFSQAETRQKGEDIDG